VSSAVILQNIDERPPISGTGGVIVLRLLTCLFLAVLLRGTPEGRGTATRSAR
jgi:hypothetical protein